MNMEEEQSLLEESVPWEVRLLKDFCNSREDVDSVRMRVDWFVELICV